MKWLHQYSSQKYIDSHPSLESNVEETRGIESQQQTLRAPYERLHREHALHLPLDFSLGALCPSPERKTLSKQQENLLQAIHAIHARVEDAQRIPKHVGQIVVVWNAASWQRQFLEALVQAHDEILVDFSLNAFVASSLQLVHLDEFLLYRRIMNTKYNWRVVVSSSGFRLPLPA